MEFVGVIAAVVDYSNGRCIFLLYPFSGPDSMFSNDCPLRDPRSDLWNRLSCK